MSVSSVSEQCDDIHAKVLHGRVELWIAAAELAAGKGSELLRVYAYAVGTLSTT